MAPPFSIFSLPFLLLLFLFQHQVPSAQCLTPSSSSPTLSISYGAYGGGGSPTSVTLCSISAERATQTIQCWRDGRIIPQIFTPKYSFSSIAGGLDILCGVSSSSSSFLLCWDTRDFTVRRLYFEAEHQLLSGSVTIGDTQICMLTTHGSAQCWRGTSYSYPTSTTFSIISSGFGFSCGIPRSSYKVTCWANRIGLESLASRIESDFDNVSMVTITAGGSHACGFDSTGFVVCGGDGESGQLDVPSHRALEYSSLALGARHTCGLRRSSATVSCWGIGSELTIADYSFETVVAGVGFTCGLLSLNFSIVCWGSGWPDGVYPAGLSLPLPEALPGPCVRRFYCICGVSVESQRLCSGTGYICKRCDFQITSPPPPPPPRSSLKRELLGNSFYVAACIVGSVGIAASICCVGYYVWNAFFITNPNPQHNTSILPPHTGIEEFRFVDLEIATRNFSVDNRLGEGGFGAVYRGELTDRGIAVAIKRHTKTPVNPTRNDIARAEKIKKGFEAELRLLSRVHHVNLIRLLGVCVENDENILVYEHMVNGSLHQMLHEQHLPEATNSWKRRIKIALDTARGIEYLHFYTVPQIIHRDIKTANILLADDWTAKVADFGLSHSGPQSNEREPATGTMGYMNWNCMQENRFNTETDVFAFGVVLSELLTGFEALLSDEVRNRHGLTNAGILDLAHYVRQAIPQNDLVLDARVAPPNPVLNEVAAIDILKETALQCVHTIRNQRPTMSRVVADLERAYGLCGEAPVEQQN